MNLKKDPFIGPISIITAIALIGVKGLSAIIFVVLVFIAGTNHNRQVLSQQEIVESSDIETASSNHIPDFSIGMVEMPIITPEPTVLIPTFTFTATSEATSTLLPTATSTATATATETSTNTPEALATVTLAPTAMTAATATKSPTALALATPTSFPLFTPSAGGIEFNVGSPLMGVGVNELYSIITQEFMAPAPGEDSGHHGVDFAFWKRGDLESIEGVPIKSILNGKVASAYGKIRNPYGYMVLIETPLSELPENFVDSIQLPTETEPSNPSNRLTCPAGFADWWSTTDKSLYVLYGHMKEPPLVKLGDTVYQGDGLGYVGNTGASTNPHLHLEMRIGPSNASFISMGHYDTTTTDLERHNYCMWRVSGKFVLFDPMELFPSGQ